MNEINSIIRDYTSGEKTIQEANDALAASGAEFRIDPEKNAIRPGEEHAYGLLDTGTGSLDKVRVKGGRLVHSVGNMPARVYWEGKCYEVHGDSLELL